MYLRRKIDEYPDTGEFSICKIERTAIFLWS